MSFRISRILDKEYYICQGLYKKKKGSSDELPFWTREVSPELGGSFRSFGIDSFLHIL